MLNNLNNHTSVKIFFFFVMLFASVLSYGQDPQVAKMSSTGMGYLEYLPSGYWNTSDKYPAIIFLHGSGERGTGTATDLEKVKNQGPPKLIKNGEKMCFTVNGKTECFIVLSPQTNEWNWQYDVVPFVKYALQTYRIDPDRVYVTGLSMGGQGAWLTAGLEDNSPNLFAAIGVMCGIGTEEVGCTVASRKINVWAFHGDADTSLGIGSGLLPITGMRNCGANPAPIWTVYAGVGHGGCWDRGYRTDHTYHNPNLYEWFLTKRKPGAAASSSSSVAPVANAGSDKTITLPASTTSMYGTGTDADGQISSYSWTKLSGPSGTSLWNANTASVSVSGLVEGTYSFRLTVKDNSGLQATDDMVVTVKPATTNQAPTVEAGATKYLTAPNNTAFFTATASDKDGSIASYKWTRISGATVNMGGVTTSTLSVWGAVVGTYGFQVVVTDNKGATATDTVWLKVSAQAALMNRAAMEGIVKSDIVMPSRRVNTSESDTSIQQDHRFSLNSDSAGNAADLIFRNMTDAYISRRTLGNIYIS